MSHLIIRLIVVLLLRLDTDARVLTVNGQRVELTTKELSILEYFLHHPNRVLTRKQIEDHVWNYDFASESNLVEVYIARLRRKLAALVRQLLNVP